MNRKEDFKIGDLFNNDNNGFVYEVIFPAHCGVLMKKINTETNTFCEAFISYPLPPTFKPYDKEEAKRAMVNKIDKQIEQCHDELAIINNRIELLEQEKRHIING